MEARYAKRGRPLRETSYRQVQVVEGATVLANRVGVAPGQRIEHNGKVLFVLPGPPQEFNAILEDHVIPWLAEHFEGHQLPKTRVSCVSGLGESDIIARFEEHHFPPHRVAVSYCAGPGRVEVRLHAEEEKDLADADEQLHAILGSTVYADERIDLPEVVGSALVHRGITVAVAESCTGGYLGHLLTNVPGSSSYFLGGVLVYSDEAKTRELDIDPGVLKTEGAVSEPVATSLAQQVRKRFSADIGVGITGIAGPDGGTEEKPVGLVYIGVASKNDCLVTRNQFPGNRVTIKEWSAMTALNQLRLFLDAQ
jgi:nicotinamide-nucleotide amidase